ncbi:MAG TPA: Rpn family recombination-promoting nuclease/putative transposase [Polyangiaceae bacterium]|nr:Rpn family recombination-promoting nuclease/putative transposase [Polyangiaceae bacterium]
MAPVSTPHDALFKRTFSDPEHVRDELRAVLPPALLHTLDLASLRPCPGSFVDPALAGSHSDLLFSVKLAGRPALLFVLFEHQSTVDSLMPLRLLGYVVRVLLQHAEQAEQADGLLPLPVVVPLVLHHSATGWTAATRLEDLFDPALLATEGLDELVPRFGFLLDDLSHQSDQALWDRAMGLVPSLTLWALRDGRDPKRLLASLTRWARLLKALAQAPSGRDALEALFRYLSVVADLPAETLVQAVERASISEGVMATVAEQWLAQGEARGIAKGKAEGLAKGKAEGMAEGEVKGKAHAVLAFLEARGLSVTAAQRAKVLGCTDLGQLEGWVRQAATAKTTAALFAPPKRPAKARR